MPISRPARSGQRRLIMLDSSTFMMAIEPRARIEPGNSRALGKAPRSSTPADTPISAPNSTRSSPNRRLSQAAIPEKTPKQSTGVAASRVMVAEDRCSVDCSSGKTGGRLVIAARRLNARAAIETTSSVASSDRRAGPSVARKIAIVRSNYRKFSCRGKPLRPQQQLAGGAPGGQVFVPLRGIGQRIGGPDADRELTRGDPAEQVAGPSEQFVAVGDVAGHGRAGQVERAAVVEALRVERGNLAACRAGAARPGCRRTSPGPLRRRPRARHGPR